MRMTGMDGERMFGDVSDKAVDFLEWEKWEEQIRSPLPDSSSTLQVEYDQFGRVVRFRTRKNKDSLVCDNCGGDYPDNGEGWYGLCGSCADREAASEG